MTPSLDTLDGLWSGERPARRSEEADLQAQVMLYLGWALVDVGIAHHSPGEGKRTKRAQGDLRRSGYQPGWPDIEVIWRGQQRPVFIELKGPKGSLTPVQRNMHARLSYYGAAVCVCRSPEEVETALRAQGVPLRATVRGWLGERLA